MLPPRRQKVRSGIERGVQREWPRHRKFVRSHQCCVPDCDMGPIEFAHVRTAANSGTGLKPADWNGVSLCHRHHAASHDIGQQTFEKMYGIDLAKLAKEFAFCTPDLAMKQAMRDAESPPTN